MVSNTTEQPTFYAVYDAEQCATMGAGLTVEDAIADAADCLDCTDAEVMGAEELQLILVYGKFHKYISFHDVGELPHKRCYWNGNVANK